MSGHITLFNKTTKVPKIKQALESRTPRTNEELQEHYEFPEN